MTLLFGLGGQELILIVLLALLFFGGKRIPELMNGIGKGVKSFRDGMNGKDTDGNGSGDTKSLDSRNGEQPKE